MRHQFLHQLHYPLGLHSIGLVLPYPLYLDVADSRLRVIYQSAIGQHSKLVVIKMMVAKCYQLGLLAAVVPLQLHIHQILCSQLQQRVHLQCQLVLILIEPHAVQVVGA